MCGNGATHTQVGKESGDGAAHRKRGDVCSNGAAHTQVGKKRGDGAAQIKWSVGVWQWCHTHSGREGTRRRGRANKREEVCGNVDAHTHSQVGKKRGDGAAQN